MRAIIAARDCASASVRSSAGWTRSKNGCGRTPIQKISTSSGANTSRSRRLKSRSFSFSGWVTGPNMTRWNIHSMYTAERITPLAAITAHTGWAR